VQHVARDPPLSSISYDNDTLDPIELLVQDRQWWLANNDGGKQAGAESAALRLEVYTCGDNNTFNLGHAHGTQRHTPERVDSFARDGEFIKQVLF
jgi:hypothetical protein